MRYIVAILLPPLAVLFTGRPLSALLNVVLTAFFWIPGVVHALIVQAADEKERRHAELMSAVTGKVIKARVSNEKQLVTALVGFVLIVGGGGALISMAWPELTIVRPKWLAAERAPTVDLPAAMPTESRAEKNASALAAMEGKTLAEIEGTHGGALSKDKATGWAEFRAFRARFDGGKVVEVEVK